MTIEAFSKEQSAHKTPIAFGWIKSIHADAVEYTIWHSGMRGLMFLLGVFGFIVFFPLGLWMSDFGTVPNLLGRFTLIFSLAGIGFLLFAIRFDFFRPEDEPTIFDRKNRKIYRINRAVQPGLMGLLKKWPISYREYDWDLIDARHHVTTATTGSTVTRYHSLLFSVKKNSADTNYIDQFTIGSSIVLGEESMAALWEHIRRFMEEAGPHLPPRECLADRRKPQGWWQSLKTTLPKSADITLFAWIKQELPFALLLLALLPLTLPMYLIWGTGNWLSHKTATPIRWPDEVQRAIGDPLFQQR